MQSQYPETSSARWLALSLAVLCFACGDDPPRARVAVQGAALGEVVDAGSGPGSDTDSGVDPELDAGFDPDMDGGVDACLPFDLTDPTCDGMDDDCNGAIDEDYVALSTSCGVGACAASGATSCVSGAVQDSCTPGTPASDDATCDDADDDCSGASDEDYVALSTSCGVGACAATGMTSCVSGAVQDSCTPGTPAPEDATCDAVDDDCNGTADEDHGVFCTGTEVTSCEQGVQVFTACSDDDVCNGDEGCAEATCTAGTPLETDDQNECTVDGCHPASGVFHVAAPIGTRCEVTGVCDAAQCVTPRSCLDWLRLAPGTSDGIYRIDVDGPGSSDPIDVYCDMTTAGGGWQLITVTAPGRVLVGPGYCQGPWADEPCAGQLHPLQASPRSEILVQGLENGAWLRYGGFSGDASSALRYFTRELALSMSTSCTAPGHVCNDLTRDPGLTVLGTSGFALEHVVPLHQWWRGGGWWVGGDPDAAFDPGRVHSSTYGVGELSAQTGLRSRASLALASVSVGTGTQALFHRDDGCADGVQHGTETGVDCGGSCAGCGTGEACAADADCASGYCHEGACTVPAASCGMILSANPLAASGRYVIDVDGPGETEPLAVYCDMTTDGGGWQLISSVRSDMKQVIVGDRYCTDPSPALNCHGQMHPLQVSANTEIMVRTPASADFTVYGGFAGTSASALRYFSRELGLGSGSSCTAPHTCANISRDPALHVARTSGFALLYNAPLVQWWRFGGWWVGANPGAAVSGRIHASSYDGVTDLRSRADPDAPSALQSGGHQLLLFRNAAPAP